MNPARSELSYLKPGVKPAFIHCYQHPGFEHGRAVAMTARAQPGEWVTLASGLTRQQADGKLHHVRRRPSVAFRPVGAFEADKDRCDDGSFRVRVRYVGEPGDVRGGQRVGAG